MNRFWIKSAVIVLTATLVIWMEMGITAAEEKKKTNQPKFQETVTYNVLSETNHFFRNIKRNKEILKDQEETRPYIANLPLSDDIQQYIFEQAEKYKFGYTYIIALMDTESQFKSDEVSRTGDIGLLQLNRRTAKWIAEQIDATNYNMKDEKENVDFGLYYLNYLRDYWKCKYPNISDEELFKLANVSFNRGASGTMEYLKHHSIDDNEYLKAVKANKAKYEKGDA